jgi:hypothetical protein
MLRRDEGGNFQPAHEIRDEGIRVDMHNRQIERHFSLFKFCHIRHEFLC